MRWVGSRVWTPDGIEAGSVRLDREDRVAEVVDQPADDPDEEGLVAPAPVNAHTHLADRLARERFEIEGLTVQEAVAPPDGLKHRILRRASHDQLVNSVGQALREAHRAGARRVLDFREGGPEGARVLREAAGSAPIEAVGLGRPTEAKAWPDEHEALLDLVDGIGISGLNDQPEEISRSEADWADEHDKRLALHLSEAEREDVELALELEPDLIVHGTQCTDEDLEQIAEAGVAVAACPRSNALFGNRPPLDAMLEAGIDVGLGTDNAMFHEPDVLAEAAFVAQEWSAIPAEDILSMACGFHLPGEETPRLGEGDRVIVVDDEHGLRAGLAEQRIQAPGRIDDERR